MVLREDPDKILDRIILSRNDIESPLTDEERKTTALFYVGPDRSGMLTARPTERLMIVLKTLGWEWRFRRRDTEGLTLLDQGSSMYGSTPELPGGVETVRQHNRKLSESTKANWKQLSDEERSILNERFVVIQPWFHELFECMTGDTTLDAQDRKNNGPKVNYELAEYAVQYTSLKAMLGSLIDGGISDRETVIAWLAHTITSFDNYSRLDKSHPLALEIILGRFDDTFEGSKFWLEDLHRRGIRHLDPAAAELQAKKIKNRLDVYIKKMIELGIPLLLLGRIIARYQDQVAKFRKLGVSIEHTFEVRTPDQGVIVFRVPADVTFTKNEV